MPFGCILIYVRNWMFFLYVTLGSCVPIGWHEKAVQLGFIQRLLCAGQRLRALTARVCALQPPREGRRSSPHFADEKSGGPKAGVRAREQAARSDSCTPPPPPSSGSSTPQGTQAGVWGRWPVLPRARGTGRGTDTHWEEELDRRLRAREADLTQEGEGAE